MLYEISHCLIFQNGYHNEMKAVLLELMLHLSWTSSVSFEMLCSCWICFHLYGQGLILDSLGNNLRFTHTNTIFSNCDTLVMACTFFYCDMFFSALLKTSPIQCSNIYYLLMHRIQTSQILSGACKKEGLMHLFNLLHHASHLIISLISN